MKHLLLLVLFSFIASHGLNAESYTGGKNENPFLNTIVGQPQQDSMPVMESPKFEGFFQSTDQIVDNSQANDSNGREYKLADAQRQAAAGVGAAVASGTNLTAAGMAELAKLNFPLAAKYFGMAGMEFAQAGATAGSGAANQGQRTVLLAEGGQSGQQASNDPAAIAQSLMTDEARQALAAQGINAESFLASLASGEIRSGEQAMSAMGQHESASWSPEPVGEIDWGSGLNALGDYPATPGEGLGSNSGERLGVSDDGAISDRQVGNEAGGPAMGFLPGSAEDVAAVANSSLPKAIALNHTPPLLKDGASAGVLKKSAKQGGAHLITGLSGGRQLASIGQPNKNKGVDNPQALLHLGIQKTKGRNIFFVARRNYRSFEHWRRKFIVNASVDGMASLRSP